MDLQQEPDPKGGKAYASYKGIGDEQAVKAIDFGKGSILKNILLAAGPMVAAQILSLLYNIVDRMYIGRIADHGLQALGAVGLCFPLIAIINAFANWFGSGGAPLCAIESGKGNHEKAQAYLNASLILTLLGGIVLTLLGLLFCQPVLQLFGTSPANMVYALPYMQIYLCGTIFSMIALAMNPFINAQGFPGVGMLTITVGAVSNIVLDPLFIFVMGMGVRGAALATVISQVLSALFVVWFLRSPKARFQICIPFRLWKSLLQPKRVWNILSLGLAGFVMQCTNSLVQIVSNNCLSIYGGDLYISVMTVISSIRQILDTPIFGLTDGTGPILSFNYGARQYERVKSGIRIMTILALAYTALVWGLILLVPGFFIALFTPDPTLQEAAVPALNTYFFAFVFQGLQYSGQTVFKSLNKKKQAIFFSLFRKVIIVVPLTLALPSFFHMGVYGVFLAEPISNVVGGSACFLCMLLTVYRRLKTVLPAFPEEENENWKKESRPLAG